MARRDTGFSHLIGALDCTAAIHNAPTPTVASWLPAGLSIQPAPTAPTGTHPYCVAYIRTDPASWTLVPFVKVHIRAMALIVLNVYITGLTRGYPGPYAYVLRWWSAKDRRVRLGGKLWGLPAADAPLIEPLSRVASRVEVAGQIKMEVRDHGEIPEWPKLRELGQLLQVPMLTTRPNGQLAVVGMYWNLSDADMRACETKLEVLPAALPTGAIIDSAGLTCQMDGTRDMATGGTFRFGSLCTMTRAGTPDRDWSPWKAGPRFRLRMDLSGHDVGPVADRKRTESGLTGD